MAIIGMDRADIEYALKQLPGSQYKVYMAIVAHANEQGTAWPSLDRIAEVANVCKRTVIYATHALEDLGLVRIKHGGGRGISNVYRLLARWVKKTVQHANRGREGRLSSIPPVTLEQFPNGAAITSGTRLLHRFGWDEFSAAEKFLSALSYQYEENIGPLSPRMAELLETRLMLNDAPPIEVAKAIVSEAVSYNALNFGYVLQVLDSTIKRGWIRDSRPGHKGYLRFRKSAWAVYNTLKEVRAGRPAMVRAMA